ncbi:MAG TPA: hypothetical protein VGO43_09025 [Pyrinomonadaceae bacterium]|jgi:hypothetical protein|nr:hypothetical protein [Pyrinomonadaceae bacterium]
MITFTERTFRLALSTAVLSLIWMSLTPSYSVAQAVRPTGSIKTSDLKSEVRDFMAKEVAVHFGAIKTLDPPPDRVNGSITTGEYTWGSFMRVVAAQSEVSGSSVIAGKDTARSIAEMGLYEARKGGKAFSQLYAAQALRHFGADLSKNAVWQSMNDAERKEWASLLDATRIYDPKKREVINLPENYLGVAARIAAYAYEFGVLKDRAFLDSLIERAALQFTNGALFADDDLPNGRYDRYSNEYIRFCWKAAEVVGRKDIQEKLKPSIKAQMRLWWDLVSDAGYGYNWGRSQGLVSYLDTLEIAAFLGENPGFRPAPLADIASLYNLAWRWIRAGYVDERHTFNLFAYGRGNYSYISPQREFQQIATSFAKIIVAHDSFMKTLEHESVTDVPAAPKLPNVARFEFFSKATDRPEGVWLVRQGNLRFALPLTVGTRPGMSDYLAAPFGLAGFANPVEEVYPSLVPFIELEDGKTYMASEGSSSIEPSNDGQSLRVIWKKWGRVGAKSGERFDTGITSEVNWRIVGDTLQRTETLIANKDLRIKRWWVAVPTTADDARIEVSGNRRTDTFQGAEGVLRVTATADWPVETSLQATGDSKLSKGVLRAIPLHLIYSAENVRLVKGKKATWRLTLEVSRSKK